MPGAINQYQQTAFATPVNGTVGDATVVLSNDNATRAKHNAHDADATIHIQSSTLAARPGFGTAQRLWVTTDGLRAYLDSGLAWNELAYLSLADGGTVSGPITATAFTGPLAGNVTGNASTATALQNARTINGVAFDGTANITITAAASTLTGTTLASGVTASSIQTLGVLTAPVMINRSVAGTLGYTNFQRSATSHFWLGLDASDNAAILTADAGTANLTWTDAGNFTFRGNVGFNGTGAIAKQVSSGTLAGVIAGLVAYGLFSS